MTPRVTTMESKRANQSRLEWLCSRPRRREQSAQHLAPRGHFDDSPAIQLDDGPSQWQPSRAPRRLGRWLGSGSPIGHVPAGRVVVISGARRVIIMRPWAEQRAKGGSRGPPARIAPSNNDNELILKADIGWRAGAREGARWAPDEDNPDSGAGDRSQDLTSATSPQDLRVRGIHSIRLAAPAAATVKCCWLGPPIGFASSWGGSAKMPS